MCDGSPELEAVIVENVATFGDDRVYNLNDEDFRFTVNRIRVDFPSIICEDGRK